MQIEYENEYSQSYRGTPLGTYNRSQGFMNTPHTQGGVNTSMGNAFPHSFGGGATQNTIIDEATQLGGTAYKPRAFVKLEKGLMRLHKAILIEDIEIIFPYEPYPQQIEYMTGVIRALNGKANALIQSPTGTGKTLCLLCATLGWLRHQREKLVLGEEEEPIKIIYCSRTHSQLKQVMNELMKTAYRPMTSILGSRDQFCVNSDFENLKGGLLNASCKRARVQEHSCLYYEEFLRFERSVVGKFGDKILDIEELTNYGLINHFCPYYFERRMMMQSDMIFMPYNYLLEPQYLDNLPIKMQNAVIIFDEAHNIEATAEDGSSFELSLKDLENAENELKMLAERVETVDPTVNFIVTKEHIKYISQPLKAFQTYLKDLGKTIPKEIEAANSNNANSQFGQTRGVMRDGKILFDMFLNHTVYNPAFRPPQSQVQMLPEVSQTRPEQFDSIFFRDNKKQTKKHPSNSESQAIIKAQNYIANTGQNRFAGGIHIGNFEDYLKFGGDCVEELSTMATRGGLMNWLTAISNVFRLVKKDHLVTNSMSMVSAMQSAGVQIIETAAKPMTWDDNDINHYKVYLHIEPEDPNNIICSIWCLDPSLAFAALSRHKPWSYILTSGTLTPLSSYESELRMPFGVVLEIPHIIEPQTQLLSCIVKRGPGAMKTINCSFNKRDDEEMIKDIGNSICNMISHIPHGILVFFPSYTMLNRYCEVWSNNDNILRRISDVKHIIREPPNSKLLKIAIQDYITHARRRGAVLLAVCRGKVSEGIDFTDDLARAVFMIGIPFPSMSDRRIQVKQAYLDDIRDNNRTTNKFKITGRDWYTLQGMRSTNQAVGRVIRHQFDFGIVVLFDERFEWPHYRRDLSDWIKSNTVTFENFGPALTEIGRFFREIPYKIKLLKEKNAHHGRSFYTRPPTAATSAANSQANQIPRPPTSADHLNERIQDPARRSLMMGQDFTINAFASAMNQEAKLKLEKKLMEMESQKSSKNNLFQYLKPAPVTKQPERREIPEFLREDPKPQFNHEYIEDEVQKRKHLFSPARQGNQMEAEIPLKQPAALADFHSDSDNNDFMEEYAAATMREPENYVQDSDEVTDDNIPSAMLTEITRNPATQGQQSECQMQAKPGPELSQATSHETEAEIQTSKLLEKYLLGGNKKIGLSKPTPTELKTKANTPTKSETNEGQPPRSNRNTTPPRAPAQTQSAHVSQRTNATLPDNSKTPTGSIDLLEQMKSKPKQGLRRVILNRGLLEEDGLFNLTKKVAPSFPSKDVPTLADQQKAARKRAETQSQFKQKQGESLPKSFFSLFPEEYTPLDSGRLTTGTKGDPSTMIFKRREPGKPSSGLLASDAIPEQKEEKEEEVMCVICYESKPDMMAAKCGHKACQSCWEKWLEQKLECPLCKLRTRKKHLTSLP